MWYAASNAIPTVQATFTVHNDVDADANGRGDTGPLGIFNLLTGKDQGVWSCSYE